MTDRSTTFTNQPPWEGAVPLAYAEGASSLDSRYVYVCRFSAPELAEHALDMCRRYIEALGLDVDEAGFAWEDPTPSPEELEDD